MIPAPSPFVTLVIVPNVAPFLNQAPPHTIGHRMEGFTANLVVKPSTGSSSQQQLMKPSTMVSATLSPVEQQILKLSAWYSQAFIILFSGIYLIIIS